MMLFMIDFIRTLWRCCLWCQVVICCLRYLRCKLWVHLHTHSVEGLCLGSIYSTTIRAHALWAFALYVEGLCPVSVFMLFWWGLMPRMVPHAYKLLRWLRSWSCMVVSSCQVVKWSSCELLRCFLSWAVDEVFWMN